MPTRVLVEFVKQSASLEGDYHLLVDTGWRPACFPRRSSGTSPRRRRSTGGVEAFTRYEDAMEWFLDDAPPDA
jgi:hypothetical protein